MCVSGKPVVYDARSHADIQPKPMGLKREVYCID